MVKLEESKAWITIHGKAAHVKDTLAGKVLGINRAKSLSFFLESHPVLVLLLRLLFIVQIGLMFPWFIRLVPDPAYFAMMPTALIYPVYLYATAHLPTMVAILTSFEVIYVLILTFSGTIALCDILRWDTTRVMFILLILFPFAIFLSVTFDAIVEMPRLSGLQAKKTGPFLGIVTFVGFPLLIFFDQIPDITVNEYPLGRIGGREVSFSTFSVMGSSYGTVAAFFFRWAVFSYRYPHSFILLKAPMLAQVPFNNHHSTARNSLEPSPSSEEQDDSPV